MEISECFALWDKFGIVIFIHMGGGVLSMGVGGCICTCVFQIPQVKKKQHRKYGYYT